MTHERIMALKLRPSGLSSAIDKERGDYVVYSGDWDVGRMYETPGFTAFFAALRGTTV
jgi:hypothetical protein